MHALPNQPSCPWAAGRRVAAMMLLLAGSGPLAAYQAGKPAAWTPDRAGLAGLDASTQFGSFHLRPPKGFQAQRQQAPGSAEGFAWVGPQREDGSRSFLMVAVVPVPEKDVKTYTAAKALDRFLAAIQQRRQEWKRTPTETGKIGGRPFVRARWTGRDANTGARMRGFNYVMFDGKSVVQLASQDLDTHAAASLKVTEAAALTFKRP